MTENAPEVDPDGPDEHAPYGYMLDRETGQRRPRKLPGRAAARETLKAPAGKTPTVDELKAAKPDQHDEDRPPGQSAKGKRPGRGKPKETAPAPPFRAGPIAAGMNKLYARTGKLVRVLDPDIGNAILSATRKEAEDDVTVGEAWEELARTNPRVRAFLMKMIAGGAWSQVIMAHAPIFLAVIMKDGIRKHVPFMKLIGALLEDNEDGTPSEASTAAGGMTGVDVEQAMAMAQQMMGPMMANMMGGGRGAPNAPRTMPGEVEPDPGGAA